MKKKFSINTNPKILAVIGMLIAATVYFAIQTSSLGATLIALERQRNELMDENRKYSSELTKFESLTQIDQKAEELGFTKPGSVIYLNREKPVAKLP